MNRAQEKSQRLLQIEKLLWAHPEGLTRSEIARRLNVHRSNLTKYLNKDDLPPSIYEDELDGNKLKIDRNADLTKTSFNLHEIMAIHLATRLLATRTDKQNPHAAAALRKLGQALQRLDHNVSQHLLRSADVMDEGLTTRDPIYLDVLQKLTEAWSAGKKVQVSHLMEDGSIHNYTFAPYLIEPYAVGQTAHVIGLREPPGKIRTFKIERLRSAQILSDAYEIPDYFDSAALLQNAWGIWFTENEPVDVVLRFTPRVALRVTESLWHHNQTTQTDPNGFLIWRAQVAEPQEMLPWIRGWGADCEVMEPTELRDNVMADVRRSAETYTITTKTRSLDEQVLLCWGKTSKSDQDFHPALYHMLDVAHVAQQLLSQRASPRWRNVLGQALGANPHTLHEWLPWLIALHDIGKISAPFQAQNLAQRQRLEQEGFDFGRYHPTFHKELHHTLTGVIASESAAWFRDMPRPIKSIMNAMLAGHHGIYQDPTGAHYAAWETLAEPPRWADLRARAAALLRSSLLRQAPDAWPKPGNLSAAIAAFNGFAILCDWLGSDSQYFSPRPYTALIDYLSHSRAQAYACVHAAGLFAPTSSAAPTLFADLFQFDQPRPLQTAVDAIPAALLAEPTLTIIEAPTGEGKTEAGLSLAHRLGAVQGMDELYIALPTMATSNAMFKRVQAYLQQHLGLPPTLVKLVHGQDFLVEDDLRIDPLSNGNVKDHPALTWFAPKKRALLAPFGVGTVDQAELAALNVRHNALRLIGLAGKVVILDEVHAYDTYMTTIIARMLRWLAELGASVILQSATLPGARRRELLEAYTGQAAPATLKTNYPTLISINRRGDIYQSHPAAYQPDRFIHLDMLHFAEDDWEGAAHWLVDQVALGGCACWIVNTVKRAQKLFEAVQALAAPDITCTLLHAQFPLEDRQRIEATISEHYGKEGAHIERPPKGIVIGTQVLEQSLDLDFDMMVSDLAPIDLLLQRAGRLHRHENRSNRNPAHSKPRLYVNCMVTDDGQLKLGSDRFYASYIMRLTWDALHGRRSLSLPADYRTLIEAVYDETPPATDSPLYSDWSKLQARNEKYEGEAKLRLTNLPKAKDPFYQTGQPTYQEDEDSNAWIVAQTRYEERPSLTVIPLMRDGDVAYISPGTEPIPLDRAADRDLQLRLLCRSVRVSHPTVVGALLSVQELPPLIKDSPLLKRCHPLWLEFPLTYKSKTAQASLDVKLGLIFAMEGDVTNESDD